MAATTGVLYVDEMPGSGAKFRANGDATAYWRCLTPGCTGAEITGTGMRHPGHPYEIHQRVTQFQVGDLVEFTINCAGRIGQQKVITEVVERVYCFGGSGSGSGFGFGFSSGACTYPGEHFKLVARGGSPDPALGSEGTSLTKSGDTTMSAKTELVASKRTAAERFMLNQSLINTDGTLTSYGSEALVQWLFEANKDAFVTELRAVYKANANARKADAEAVAADEDE